MNNAKGFNLIELMTTLSIFSLLTLIALPSMLAINQNVRANSNIRLIQNTLSFARNTAINYGTRVTVCPISSGKCNTDWSIGLTVFIDSGQKNVIDGNDILLRETNEFNENDIIQYNRKSIRFQPDGLASGTNGTLVYCPDDINNQYSKAVIINQAGRIRFSKKKNIVCKPE
ncbi:GspH/FimT family pseudopilin [Shewanella sp. ALD9]|jgi:type IV fimbrial biogenesis protein FimT|uniref:GspH/FimT family pseudopilin n=1 Tax=unclassified Shewanella TaxID=196818 RepID=UPI000C348BE2|nr:GspH/FimT family pseudopilin [Shewanella sp. ALD9]PKH31839.1 general secretion pathway protein GspH [Shewanella sp. ALD9]